MNMTKLAITIFSLIITITLLGLSTEVSAREKTKAVTGDIPILEAQPTLDEGKETSGGMFIPDEAKEKPSRGGVISVGSGEKEKPAEEEIDLTDAQEIYMLSEKTGESVKFLYKDNVLYQMNGEGEIQAYELAKNFFLVSFNRKAYMVDARTTKPTLEYVTAESLAGTLGVIGVRIVDSMTLNMTIPNY